MGKIIAELKTRKDFVNEYDYDSKLKVGLPFDITLSNLSKRNGFVKGIVDYGYVKNFGTVRMPFQFAIYDNFSEEGFDDWTYEDGRKIPYEIYIWETIKWLNEEKLLNK